MRANEFIREEEKLDEVLPLVGMAAKTAGGMLAKGAAKAAGAQRPKGVGSMGAAPNQQQNAQTIGAPDDQPQGAASTDPARTQAIDKAKDQVIRPGANINLPTAGTGGTGEFKITGIQGDEVEIENPRPTPGEPTKTVYKKDDIKRSMSL